MNYIKTGAFLIVLLFTSIIHAQSTDPDSRCPDCIFTNFVVEAEVINLQPVDRMLISLTPGLIGRRNTFSIPVSDCEIFPEEGSTVYVAISGTKKYGPRTGINNDHCYVNAVQIDSVIHVCEIPIGLQSICPDDFPFVW